MAEARAFCNNLGQKLFEPKYLEINSEVSKLAKEQVGNTWGYWIGIHDQINQGNFVYDSDNKPIVYENWSPSEPNGDSREDCTVLGTWEKWVDTNCATAMPFICESGKLKLIFFLFLVRNGLKFLVSCEKSKFQKLAAYTIDE